MDIYRSKMKRMQAGRQADEQRPKTSIFVFLLKVCKRTANFSTIKMINLH